MTRAASPQWAPPVGSQLVFLSPMDAMKKIQSEGTTSSLTATPYASMLCSGTIWIAYGVLANDATIWLPNVSPILVSSSPRKQAERKCAGMRCDLAAR